MPRDPAEAEYHVGPAAIGIAVAWLAFFAIAIEQALTAGPGVLQLAVMHLR